VSLRFDTVVSALLSLPYSIHTPLAFVRIDKTGPAPSADLGLSAWPPARGGFKRVGARTNITHSQQDLPKGIQAR